MREGIVILFFYAALPIIWFIGFLFGIQSLVYFSIRNDCVDWKDKSGLETKFNSSFTKPRCLSKIGDEWVEVNKVVKVLIDGKLIWAIDRR